MEKLFFEFLWRMNLRKERLKAYKLTGGHASTTAVREWELEIKCGSRNRKRYMWDMKEKLVTNWIWIQRKEFIVFEENDASEVSKDLRWRGFFSSEIKMWK